MERKFIFIFAGWVFVLFNASFLFAQQAPSVPGVEASSWLNAVERQQAMDKSFHLAREKVILEELENRRPSQVNWRQALARNLNPYLEIEFAQDSNIYLTPKRTKDFVSTFTPGLKLNFSGEDNFVEFDAGAKLTSYADKTSMNSQNPYFNFSWRKHFNRYHLNLVERFRKDFDVRSSFITEAEGKVRYLANDFNFTYGGEYNRLAFDAGLRRYDYFYPGEFKRDNNYNENIVSLTGYTKLAPKTRLLFEYDHGIIVYPEHPEVSRDGYYEEGWVGLTGEITSKVSGIAKLGYQYRVYDQGADWHKPVLGIDLIYHFKERTDFLFRATRSAEQALSEGENYYDFFRLEGGVAHKFAFNPKLSIGFNGLYENDDYPLSSFSFKREDKIYALEGAFKYNLQLWLDAALAYTFRERDSNSSGSNYVDHIFSLKLRGSF